MPGLREVALAVEHGLGMSVLPRYLVAEQLSRGSLVTLFEPEIPPLNTLHVAIRDGLAHKDPAIRMLEEALLVDAREHDAQFYSPEATATT